MVAVSGPNRRRPSRSLRVMGGKETRQAIQVQVVQGDLASLGVEDDAILAVSVKFGGDPPPGHFVRFPRPLLHCERIS
jgi:hypothetical protein